MKKQEEALEIFSEGFNCAQAVAGVFADEAGMDKKSILKALAGFGGGMGRTDQVCGAVSGAVMVLGLKYGTGKESKELVYAKIKKLTEKFKTKNGSVSCTALLGCNMSTKEGLEAAKKKEVHTKVCPKFVSDAVEILDEIL